METRSKNYTDVNVAKVSAFGAEIIYRCTFTLSLVGITAWVTDTRMNSQGRTQLNFASNFPNGCVLNWVYISSRGVAAPATDWISLENLNMIMILSNNSGAQLSQAIQATIQQNFYGSPDQIASVYNVNDKVIIPFNLKLPGAIFSFEDLYADVRCGNSGANVELPQMEILMSLSML